MQQQCRYSNLVLREVVAIPMAVQGPAPAARRIRRILFDPDQVTVEGSPG